MHAECTFQFCSLPLQVDVKALKDLLGENIRSLHAKEEEHKQQQQQQREEAGDEEAERGFTFQEVRDVVN